MVLFTRSLGFQGVSVMQKVRLGIVGPGEIVRRVMLDFHRSQGIELVAIASRSLERAKAAAEKYGAKYAFGSYEELAECQEVDLVYIATPHVFHCQQSILMMRHGKHVLCEKPLCVTREEAKSMVDCAKEQGVFLMEAMWTRCFPASQKLAQLVSQGAVGQVRYLSGGFGFPCDGNVQGRLMNPDLAGGSLLDVGVYPIMLAIQLLGPHPSRIWGDCAYTTTGVDAHCGFQLQYGNGATAQLSSAIDVVIPTTAMIGGEKGYLEIPEFWHPTQIRLVLNNGETQVYTYPAENQGFRYEFTHVADCIRQGLQQSPLVPWEDSLAEVEIQTQLRRQWGISYPCET